MADLTTGKVRVRRTTTWGNPPALRTPRFVRLYGAALRGAKRILAGVIVIELVTLIGLSLYLTYGTTFSRVYASDGSDRSCELHFLARVKQ
jgi:hypothetical protein